MHMDGDDDDEALALRLQAEFDREAHGRVHGGESQTLPVEMPSDDLDYMMALRMQADYDRAFNRQLAAHQRRVNGNQNAKGEWRSGLRITGY